MGRVTYKSHEDRSPRNNDEFSLLAFLSLLFHVVQISQSQVFCLEMGSGGFSVLTFDFDFIYIIILFLEN